jgi:hypothetical protein
MAAGHQARAYLFFGKTAPASATTEVTKLAINDEMRLNLVVDVVLGQVASTPTLNLQDSTGFGFWNTAKSAALSASTDKTVTVAGSTWTAAAHGYTVGQMVVINSTGNMPGGMQAGQRTFIQSATTNTFVLSNDTSSSSSPVTTTDSGTGTLTATAATEVTLRLNVEVAGDQAVMPLRPLGRVTVTCTGGQTAQVLDVRTGYCY